MGDLDDEVTPIIRYAAVKAPFLLVLPFIDEPILGLFSAQPVEIHLVIVERPFELIRLGGFIVAAVKKAFSIFRPGSARVARPFDKVGQILTGPGITDSYLAPVGTGA